MKVEYRYLSEERAAEIDAMGIITPGEQKLRINYAECMTNEDESIVFQRIFIASPHPNDNIIDIDQYLLFYKGYQYVLEIDDIWFRKIMGSLNILLNGISKVRLRKKRIVHQKRYYLY